MKYSTVENLIWCGPEHTAFNCDVTFEALGKVPFCCDQTDPTPHAKDIWSRAMANEFGVIAEPPTSGA